MVNFPTLEQIEEADIEQIIIWWRNTPSFPITKSDKASNFAMGKRINDNHRAWKKAFKLSHPNSNIRVY